MDQVRHATSSPPSTRTTSYVQLDDVMDNDKFKSLIPAAQYWTERWSNDTNYRYWKSRSMAEAEPAGVEARRLFYEATRAFKSADFETAAENYQQRPRTLEVRHRRVPRLRGRPAQSAKTTPSSSNATPWRSGSSAPRNCPPTPRSSTLYEIYKDENDPRRPARRPRNPGPRRQLARRPASKPNGSPAVLPTDLLDAARPLLSTTGSCPMTSAIAPRTIRVGHSPDSDDAFMFYALAHDKLDTGGLRVRPPARRHRDPEPSRLERRARSLRRQHPRLRPPGRQVRPARLRRQHGRPLRPEARRPRALHARRPQGPHHRHPRHAHHRLPHACSSAWARTCPSRSCPSTRSSPPCSTAGPTSA